MKSHPFRSHPNYRLTNGCSAVNRRRRCHDIRHRPIHGLFLTGFIDIQCSAVKVAPIQNPKPLACPVSRSVTMLTRSTVPCAAKRDRSPSSVAPKLRFPTKMFFILRYHESRERLVRFALFYVWTSAARLTAGYVLRPVNRADRISDERLGEKAIWLVLRQYAQAAGIPSVAPHDARRTCAKLCRAAGGQLKQAANSDSRSASLRQ